jgi:RHS repeat-associated protein
MPLAETNSGGTTQNEYVYFSGGRTARRDLSGNVYYYFSDQIGTEQLIFNATSGTMCYDSDNTPFGYEMVYTSACAQEYQFAGMELDSETGNYYTWFRNYEPNLGRWMSPDPVAGNVANPQSLNRYAYVLNNPTSLVDPLGLDGLPTGTCSSAQPPRADLWCGPGNTWQQRPCTTMDCADQYYGGSFFYGDNTVMEPVCVQGGVMGYCGQGEWSTYTSPTGADEFDLYAPPIQVGTDQNGNPIYIYPGAGLDWAAPPGSAVTNSSGRTSTSTGTLGFSDLLWSERSGTSNILTGTNPSRTTSDELRDALSGNYIFGLSPESAASRNPASMAAFGQANVPFQPSEGGSIWVFQIVPLPGWWFSGQ